MKQVTQPATKDDLRQLEKRLGEKFATKELLKKELSSFERRLNERFDDVLNKLVDVMGQLRNIHEDSVVGSYQIHELGETAEDHEKRIKKLEKTQQAS